MFNRDPQFFEAAAEVRKQITSARLLFLRSFPENGLKRENYGHMVTIESVHEERSVGGKATHTQKHLCVIL